jgi:hypothetical protein
MDASVTRKRKKTWSKSVGEYGHRIRIFEDPLSGICYGEMRDPSRPGRYICRSLGHRDKARAVAVVLYKVMDVKYSAEEY